MINDTLDIIEWILMGAFLLSAINIRTISLLMLVNIGLSMALYDWFSTIPPVAAAASTTLINVFTIIAILTFGEKSIQKVIQPIILLGFIGIDALLLSDLIYNGFEAVLLSLYGGMLLSISWSAGHGGRICLLAAGNYYSGRYSSSDTGVSRDITNS